jgi:hypothetical protein
MEVITVHDQQELLLYSRRSQTALSTISNGQNALIKRNINTLVDNSSVEANLDSQEARGSSNDYGGLLYASGSYYGYDCSTRICRLHTLEVVVELFVKWDFSIAIKPTSDGDMSVT